MSILHLDGLQCAIRDIIANDNSCQLPMIRNVIVLQIAMHHVISLSVRRLYIDGVCVTSFRVPVPWNR